MADWATLSSLGTAGGTLVLAVATFASVRSSNRAARASERALMAGLRPVLAPSRLEDAPEKVGFVDDHWVRVEGGHAVIDVTESAIYFVVALRNVGRGLAVLDRWDFIPQRATNDVPHREPADFRRLTRDIYVPGGDRGFWQGALRDPSDPLFTAARDAITARLPLTVDLLYGDHEGGQRAITRFGLAPTPSDGWLATVGRHWNLDRADPR